jgi:hypothetical protein
VLVAASSRASIDLLEPAPQDAPPRDHVDGIHREVLRVDAECGVDERSAAGTCQEEPGVRSDFLTADQHLVAILQTVDPERVFFLLAARVQHAELGSVQRPWNAA